MTQTITLLDNTTITNWNVDESILSKDRFWVKSNEDLVPEFVSTTRGYLKARDIEYNITSFEDIDKSNPWMIFTAVNFPFTINFNDKSLLSSKQLFQGIPESVINELVHGNAYLILSFEQESFTTNFLNLFYALYRNNPIVPMNKLIHITAAANIHDIYDQYCIKNNILEEEKIKMWFSPHSLLGPIKYHANLYAPTKTNKVKKFINFNRAPRSHRLIFTSLLAEYNLLDQGYVSLGIAEYNIFQNDDDILEYVKYHLPNTYKWNNGKDLYIRTVLGTEKLVNKLPLTIDTSDFTYGPVFGYSGNLMNFYNTSYFSIVSNTHYFSADEKAVTLNEKEYKPILARHPFILIASPGTLALLKTLGFKTFNHWFDESYDDETDDEIRMSKLINEVNRLCRLDNGTWDKMIEEMTPILEHNYNWIVNHTSDIIFNTDFKHILEYAV
jgi:hypothetical protein